VKNEFGRNTWGRKGGGVSEITEVSGLKWNGKKGKEREEFSE
jgi:hypothetical protein